jgi:YVTN family beta-propeller protein
MDQTGTAQRRFGPYVLHELLGAGAMGQVYRAEDTRHDRWVALKVLPEGFGDDREYQQRFRRESRVAAQLREPHIIPIHDYGDVDGRLFIDMRMVDGEDLAALLKRTGPLPPARAARLVGQIAEALDAAHAAGLVHRDVKPSNVLVTARDFVYVVDFGVAQSVAETRTSLTITGTTVGTLEYMAPERFTNQPIDGRADVYSLSCVLAECLTGQRPFSGEDLPALMYAHLYLEPPRVSALVPGLPPALDDVIARGMAKDPDERFATAAELATAAEDALTGSLPAAAPPAEGVPARPAGSPASGTTAHPLPNRMAPPPRTASPPRRPVPVSAPPTPAPAGAADGRPRNEIGTAAPGPDEAVTRGPAAVGAPTFVPRSPPGGPPDGVPPGAGTPPAAPPDTPDGPRPRRRRRIALVATTAVAVVLAVTAAVLLWPRSGGSPASRSANVGAGSSAPATSAAPARPATSLATPTAGAVVPVPPDPQFMAIAPNGRFGYITHPSAGVVSVFDTTLAKITATIPIPEGPPQYLGFSPDGQRAYVSITSADFTKNAIDVLDTRTNKVLRSVPVGKRPFVPVTSPDGRLLYVPLHDERYVDVIDTTTDSVTTQIPVVPSPHWMAVSSDGKLGYTANHESGVITAINLSTDQVITTIPVGTAPHSIAFSPDGSRVSVVCFQSNDVFEIDTRTQQVVARVKGVGAKPQDIVYAPDGARFYTANVDGGTISVVDAANGAVTARIPTGSQPTSIAVLPNGRQAYVTNFGEGTVRVLDVGD